MNRARLGAQRPACAVSRRRTSFPRQIAARHLEATATGPGALDAGRVLAALVTSGRPDAETAGTPSASTA